MKSSFISVSNKKIRGLIALTVLLFSLLFYLQFKTPSVQADAQAQEAALLFLKAQSEIKSFRLSLGIGIDKTLDPKETGLIGCEYSDLTSTSGDLQAKQLSVNPAYAALIVVWLKQMGVKKGDAIAASFSGSFPALNLAAICAFDTLKLRATVFSSIGASVYGANIPGLTWLEMEKHLLDKGIVKTRTRYASLGGIVDTEGGIDGTGFALGEKAISINGAQYIREGTPKTVERDVLRRMKLFFSCDMPKAFVNVGGNVTSLGWVPEAALLKNGPLIRTPKSSSAQRGVIFRMIEQGVPVIHLLNIQRLNDHYHVASSEKTTQLTEAFPEANKQFLIALAFLLIGWFAIALTALWLEGRSDH